MTTTFMEGIILDGGDVQVMSDTGIDEDDEGGQINYTYFQVFFSDG